MLLFIVQLLKIFGIQSGTKITSHYMFNMLPLVSSDFCAMLYSVLRVSAHTCVL